MQETWVWFPGQEAPLEKEMATHSSILAWRIVLLHGQRSLVGCSLWGHKESDTIAWANTHIYTERKGFSIRHWLKSANQAHKEPVPQSRSDLCLLENSLTQWRVGPVFRSGLQLIRWCPPLWWRAFWFTPSPLIYLSIYLFILILIIGV